MRQMYNLTTPKSNIETQKFIWESGNCTNTSTTSSWQHCKVWL